MMIVGIITAVIGTVYTIIPMIVAGFVYLLVFAFKLNNSMKNKRREYRKQNAARYCNKNKRCFLSNGHAGNCKFKEK